MCPLSPLSIASSTNPAKDQTATVEDSTAKAEKNQPESSNDDDDDDQIEASNPSEIDDPDNVR